MPMKIPDGFIWKALLALLSLLVTIQMGTSAYLIKGQMGIRERLSAMEGQVPPAEALVCLRERIVRLEGSCVSAQDGQTIWKAISEIREELASLPRDSPPVWFVQRVDRIDARLLAIEHEIAALQARLGGS